MPPKALLGCGLTPAVITFAHWSNGPTVSLGLLYLGPLLVAAIFLSRGQMIALALTAAVLKQVSDPGLAWPDGFRHFAIAITGFTSAPLLVNEIFRRKRFEAQSASDTFLLGPA